MDSLVQESAAQEGSRPPVGFEAERSRRVTRLIDDKSGRYLGNAQQSNPNRWLDVKSAAAYAGISEGFCCSLMTNGKMRSIKRGRLRRTRASWVDVWILSGGRA